MTDEPSKKLLTVLDVTERLNVSERTVFRWLKQGCLKSYRFGKIRRISEDDLDDFLTSSQG